MDGRLILGDVEFQIGDGSQSKAALPQGTERKLVPSHNVWWHNVRRIFLEDSKREKEGLEGLLDASCTSNLSYAVCLLRKVAVKLPLQRSIDRPYCSSRCTNPFAVHPSIQAVGGMQCVL